MPWSLRTTIHCHHGTYESGLAIPPAAGCPFVGPRVPQPDSGVSEQSREDVILPVRSGARIGPELAATLPPHHRDPFDRMLIAQAIEEELTLVSHDRRLQPYRADFLWN